MKNAAEKLYLLNSFCKSASNQLRKAFENEF